MKWHVGAKCQKDYANEMVAIMGPSAKHSTANKFALAEMPWTTTEYQRLEAQFKNLASIPNYPGSYIIGRYTNFAFLAAYNNHADPVDELLQYINTINKEINRKRTEFELEILPIGSTLADKRMDQVVEAIDGMDEALKSQNAAAIDAALAAIDNADIAELKSAAKGFSGSDETSVQIAGWLNDAAAALESYLD
jgi:hypothetical protein